ncbi:MAG TPA: MFS transporter [Aquihabitans sp.]|jgi:EmrB/QacA subfamily drug resistance transporter|nr:MFS transporter [Aquihabitans sp.]
MSAPPDAEPLRFGTAAGRWALVGTVLGSGMTMLDGTVVNIALPRLGEDLDADFAGLQWVVNGYTLALASLILLGGSLGDRLGRRRIFNIGVVWFTIASLLCAIAPTVGMLVAARVLQGIGGALLVPGSLAMLQASFHPDDRARAIGAWSGLGGVTAAIGPFLGGWLVDAASWRWIFLLNIPLGALVLYISVVHIPETRDPTVTGRLDLAGAVLGAAGLAAITYGFIERSFAVGGVGAALLVAFVIAEQRVAHPMLSLSIFRSRQFSAASAVTFVIYGGLGMALFLVGLVLQEAMGYSPLEAGIATLPITVMMLAFSARAGGLARRIGPRLPMTVGPLVMAVGLALMVRIEPGAGYVDAVLPALVVFSAGLTLTVAPLTATALAAADARHSGLASGVNNAVARTGQLLAVALIPIVAGFEAEAAVAAGPLVDGFHRVALVAAAAVAAGGLLSWAFIRSDVLEAPATEEGALTGATPGKPTYHCGTTGPPLAPDETPVGTRSG